MSICYQAGRKFWRILAVLGIIIGSGLGLTSVVAERELTEGQASGPQPQYSSEQRSPGAAMPRHASLPQEQPSPDPPSMPPLLLGLGTAFCNLDANDMCELVIPPGDPRPVSDLITEVTRALDDAGEVFEQILDEILQDPLGLLLIDDPLECVTPFSVSGALANIPGVAGNQVTFCEIGGQLHTISGFLCTAANAANQLTVQHGLPFGPLTAVLTGAWDGSEALARLVPCLYSMLMTAEMYICGGVQGITTGLAICCPCCPAGAPTDPQVKRTPDGGDPPVQGPFDFALDLVLDRDEFEDAIELVFDQIVVLAEQFLGVDGEPPVLPAVTAAWQYNCHVTPDGQAALNAQIFFDAKFKPDGTQFFTLEEIDETSFRLNGLPVFSAVIDNDVWELRFGQGNPQEDWVFVEGCPLALVVTAQTTTGTNIAAFGPDGENVHPGTKYQKAKQIMEAEGFRTPD